MAYNVTNWETKELDNLRIPVADFSAHVCSGWFPETTNNDDGSIKIALMGGIFVKGIIEGEFISVSSITASGEGSGNALIEIIQPALEKSTGKLVAIRVWEGGDSIDKLTAIDGEVKTEQVEL